VGTLSELKRRLVASTRPGASRKRLAATRLIATASLLAAAVSQPAALHGQELSVRWLSDPGLEGVAAALNGRQVNGQAVELICTQDDKMSVLGRITGLGDAVEDVELALPSLDDIYRHFGHLDAPGGEEQR